MRRRWLLFIACLGALTQSPALLAAGDTESAGMVADGAADARQDFANGVLILLGGEGIEPGVLDLGNGREIEIATDACALGPDPAGYIADYNREMKARVRAAYGVDVDELLLQAAP